MKRKACICCIAMIVVLLLIVGIPIAINEAYKANYGYITQWWHLRLFPIMAQF